MMFPWHRTLVPLLSLLGCARGAPERTALVYSETSDFSSVGRRVGLLRAHQLDLIQVLAPSNIGQPELLDLIRKCEREDVGFRAWLVLPRERGLWPGESNLAEFGEGLRSLLAWIRREDLPIRWITFDLEPAWDYTQRLLVAASDVGSPARFRDLVALFREHHDPARFRLSHALLTGLVAEVHRAGLRAHAVTYPIIVDDAADDDPDLQDAFDIPVTGIAWDEISLMVYRSTWEKFSSGPLSEDLVFAYGRGALDRFGERAGLDLGVVGPDPVTMSRGYTDPGALLLDAAAARAAGVERLHMYSLEGAADGPGAEAWLRFAEVKPKGVPVPDRNVEKFRALFTVLDGILSPP